MFRAETPASKKRKGGKSPVTAKATPGPRGRKGKVEEEEVEAPSPDPPMSPVPPKSNKKKKSQPAVQVGTRASDPDV